MRFSKTLAVCTLAFLTQSFLSVPSLASKPKEFSLAQRNQLTLENEFVEWAFVGYEWLSANDRSSIYESTIYIEVKGNTMSIYNTYNREPLGRIASCGGLGCDLGKGSLLATLSFANQGNAYVVRDASQKAAFLKGSRCKVVPDAMPVLECFSNQAPTPGDGRNYLNMPSIIKFVPGT